MWLFKLALVDINWYFIRNVPLLLLISIDILSEMCPLSYQKLVIKAYINSFLLSIKSRRSCKQMQNFRQGVVFHRGVLTLLFQYVTWVFFSWTNFTTYHLLMRHGTSVGALITLRFCATLLTLFYQIYSLSFILLAASSSDSDAFESPSSDKPFKLPAFFVYIFIWTNVDNRKTAVSFSRNTHNYFSIALFIICFRKKEKTKRKKKTKNKIVVIYC